MLGKAGMGELGIIQSTVGIFSAFAGVGMGLTATKYVAQYKKEDPARAGAMLSLSALVTWSGGIVITLAMLVLAPWLARHTIAAPHLTDLLRVGAWLLLFGAVNGAQTGALAGFEAFRSIARVNFIAGISSFPLMAGGAWRFGLTGAVWGLVASQALNCVLSHMALRSEAARATVPFRGSPSAKDWSVLWRFSLPSTLCTLLFGPANWAASAILVNRPNGYAEMGIFNVTMSWFNVVAFFPGVLAQVVLPLLASQSGSGARQASRKIAAAATKANAVSVIPLALVLSLMSPLIMSAYGSQFREGWPVLIVSLTTAAVLALQVPAVQAITAAGRMWTVFFTYASYGLIYVSCTAAFADFGALGIATARLIAYLVNAVWVVWISWKFVWLDSPTGQNADALASV